MLSSWTRHLVLTSSGSGKGNLSSFRGNKETPKVKQTIASAFSCSQTLKVTPYLWRQHTLDTVPKGIELDWTRRLLPEFFLIVSKVATEAAKTEKQPVVLPSCEIMNQSYDKISPSWQYQQFYLERNHYLSNWSLGQFSRAENMSVTVNLSNYPVDVSHGPYRRPQYFKFPT